LLLALAFGLAAVWLGVAYGATPAEQANLAARWTARAAFPFFLIAYAASSLLRLWPSELTKALMRRRRQWGLAFALAHTIHLVALAINIIIYNPRPFAALVGGAVAYAILYAMALTSTDKAQRVMGIWWKRLHRVGIHYLWIAFLAGYGGRAVHIDPGYHAEGRIAVALLFAVLGLRVYLRFGPKRATAAA
jgi:methionine sulfoxide reductase heme-binding subunit